MNRVHPISVSLSGNGKTIKRFNLTSAAPCTPSGSSNTSEAWKDVKIARNGSFSDTDTFTQKTSDGGTTTWNSQMKGRLTARGGSGTTRDIGTVKDASGAVTRTCDSGVVKFKLSRGSRIFGGLLNQTAGFPAFGAKYPVSVIRNRSAMKLTSFRIRYIAKCGTANNHTNSFNHSNIAVSGRGKFSTTRRFSYASPTGAKYAGSFKLAGKLRSAGASGTYRATFTATTATGAKFPCDTGTLKWSARGG